MPEKISSLRVLKRRILNFFKTKPEKLTLMEIIAKINKDYHFTSFDENLINEIYSILLDYGSMTVVKEEKYKYTLCLYQIITDNIDSKVELEISENGLYFKEDLNED